MSDHLVVIPAFNEAPSLGDVVSRARRHGAVLVVDDGSSDGSGAVASAAGADVLRVPRRRGKGEALRLGFRDALARGVDRVVTLDGDGQHDPADIPRLLQAARAAPDALVIGGRLRWTAADEVMPPGRLAALRVAGFFINWLTGVPVADTQSGFRVYPAGALAALTPRHGGFVLETEMLIRAVAAGFSLCEVPIAAVATSGRRSRFRPGRDGVAVGAYLAAQVVRRWGSEAIEIAAALARPFIGERRRARHRAHAAFAAPHSYHLAAWALATGVFTMNCVAETWRGWWRDPRARVLRLAGLATAATPLLLVLALVQNARPRPRLDLLVAFVARVYSQERLACVLPAASPSRAPASPRPRAAATEW